MSFASLSQWLTMDAAVAYCSEGLVQDKLIEHEHYIDKHVAFLPSTPSCARKKTTASSSKFLLDALHVSVDGRQDPPDSAQPTLAG